MVRIKDIIILIASIVKPPLSAVTTATFLVVVVVAVRRNTRTVSLKPRRKRNALKTKALMRGTYKLDTEN
jgi:hypothetical protein